MVQTDPILLSNRFSNKKLWLAECHKKHGGASGSMSYHFSEVMIDDFLTDVNICAEK